MVEIGQYYCTTGRGITRTVNVHSETRNRVNQYNDARTAEQGQFIAFNILDVSQPLEKSLAHFQSTFT
jgi:hypothetical protein